MSLFLRFAAASDVGRVRRDNQDSGYAGPNLIAVADGVGGAARGDIASSAAIEVLSKLDVPAGNDALSELSATIHLAHDRLADIVDAHPDLDGTSTTVSAAIFDGTHLRIGHVGDSRGYLLRDGVIQQLTSDHSLVQSLVDEGRITEEEARVHPHRNLILKAVDSVHEPEPDLFSFELHVDDRILFCSDGCSGVLENDDLAALLVGEPLENVSNALVKAALDAGSSDNVTVVVAAVVDGDAPGPAAPVTVGAAASTPHLTIPDETTGNLTDSDVHVLAKAADPEAIRYAPQPPPQRRWVRRLVTLVVLIGIIAGAGYGGYRYSQSRYYVKSDGSSVTIYKGVDFDLPLITLHHVLRPAGFELDELSDEYRSKVMAGVAKGSLEEIEKYLQDAYCALHADPALNDLYKIGLTPKRYPPVGSLPSIGSVQDPDPILAWSAPHFDGRLLPCKQAG